MDPATGAYNRPLLTAELQLIEGYRRLQGIVFRKGDGRFIGRSVQEAIAAAPPIRTASWSIATRAAARAF
jgi:hypothetical protein